MKTDTFMEVLGLTVVAVIILNVVASRNSAQVITSAGKAWATILKGAQGK